MGIDLGTTNTCVSIWLPAKCKKRKDGKVKPGLDVLDDGVHIVTDLPNGATDDNGLLPSFVTYSLRGKKLMHEVGERAKKNLQDPVKRINTVYDQKCLLGRERTDINDDGILPARIDLNAHNRDRDTDNRDSHWTFRLASISDHDKKPIESKTPHVELTFPNGDGTTTKRHVTPVKVLSHILKKAKSMVNAFMRQIGEITDEEEIFHAVITVPAVFNQKQKKEVGEAASMAGLKLLGKPTEPACAARAYGFDRHKFHSARLLTFDFGGGTLDVNVVEVERSHLRVYASRGERLGGRHFDAAMYDLVDEQIRSTPGVIIRDQETYRQALLAQCERLKINLTRQDDTAFDITALGGRSVIDVQDDVKPIRISRETFENYPKCQELVAKAIKLVQRVLKRRKLRPEDIKHVLLIGGSSEMPMIRNALKNFFRHDGKKRPIFIRDVPHNFAFQAVAKGAAIRAAQLSSISESLPDQRQMTEVVSLPIGVGFGKGGQLFSRVIPAGFCLPGMKIEKFRPMFKGKKKIVIKVFEGYSYLTAHNHPLGQFELELSDSKKIPTIVLNAELNASGELLMSASVGKGKCEHYEIQYLEQRDTDKQQPPPEQLAIDKAEYKRLLASHQLLMVLSVVGDHVAKCPFGAVNEKERKAFVLYFDARRWFTENEATGTESEFREQLLKVNEAKNILIDDEDCPEPDEDDYCQYDGDGDDYYGDEDDGDEMENRAKRARLDDEQEQEGTNDDGENFLMPLIL